MILVLPALSVGGHGQTLRKKALLDPARPMEVRDPGAAILSCRHYHPWLSEQRGLRVAEYLLAQRQQLCRDDPMAGRVAGDRSSATCPPWTPPARRPTPRRARPCSNRWRVWWKAGSRAPVVNQPGKNEKNRRVEVVFAETQGFSMTWLCAPAEAPKPRAAGAAPVTLPGRPGRRTARLAPKETEAGGIVPAAAGRRSARSGSATLCVWRRTSMWSAWD